MYQHLTISTGTVAGLVTWDVIVWRGKPVKQEDQAARGPLKLYPVNICLVMTTFQANAALKTNLPKTAQPHSDEKSRTALNNTKLAFTAQHTVLHKTAHHRPLGLLSPP